MKSEIMQVVKKHYGSQRSLARAMGVGEAACSHWFTAGYFPPAIAIRIATAMGGHVKAADLVKPE